MKEVSIIGVGLAPHAHEILFRIVEEGATAIVGGHESDMPGLGGVLTVAGIMAVLGFTRSTRPECERLHLTALSRTKQATALS